MYTATHQWMPGVEPLPAIHPFMRSVFTWMCGGLAMTAVAAVWVVLSPGMQNFVLAPGFLVLRILSELAIVFVLASEVERLAPVMAGTIFLLFSLLNGFTIGGIAFAWADTDIFEAFAAAAGMFGVTAFYGLLARKDLTSWGSLLFMGLNGVLIASAVSLFAPSPKIAFVICVAGVAVFLALTAFDMQRLKRIAAEHGEEATAFAIVGALALYLDFINIFLFAGRRRRT